MLLQIIAGTQVTFVVECEEEVSASRPAASPDKEFSHDLLSTGVESAANNLGVLSLMLLAIRALIGNGVRGPDMYGGLKSVLVTTQMLSLLAIPLVSTCPSCMCEYAGSHPRCSVSRTGVMWSSPELRPARN